MKALALLLLTLAGGVLPAQTVFFEDDFSTNKGWQLPSPWSRDVATAFSQTSPPMSEPGTDHTQPSTDNRIIGDTIGNVYATNDGNVYWATSPVIDCSAGSQIALTYARALGLANGSSASIEVTNNGTTWTTVWASTVGVTIYELAWQYDVQDISAVAAGSATVQVRFGIGPTGANPHTGWCIDDLAVYQPGHRIIQVNLGSATGPQITHQQSAAGTPRDLGNQDIGAGATAPVTIFVSNTGNASLTVSSPQMGGVNWYDFVINSSTFNNVLPPGASTSFTVAFDPTGPLGARTANVQISHNGTQGATPFDIPVRGNGTNTGGPDLKVHEGAVTVPQIPHNLPAGGGRDFGNQLVTAGPTATLTITIENSGGSALMLGMPVLGGTNPTEFVLSTAGFQTNLTPGTSTSFGVAFEPTSAGVKLAQVSFTHNDTTIASPFLVNVTGEGVLATELRVTTQPTDSAVGQLLATPPAIAITDAVGNVATGDNTSQVQVAITASTGNPSASLSGTLTVTAINGYATFADLEISHGATGYTLTFTNTNGALGTVVSDPFNVSGGGGNGDEEEEESCSSGAGSGASLPAVLLLSVAALLWRRRRA
jgi:MYXO-CTERM domain-containing protein